jgi:hypothetical protein
VVILTRLSKVMPAGLSWALRDFVKSKEQQVGRQKQGAAA